MHTTFEQFVRQALHNLKERQRNLKERQRNLERAISDSQTRVIQWIIGLFVGAIIIIAGLSSVLVMAFMPAR